MTTLPWVKYDHGPLSGAESLSDLPTNCFPARDLLRGSSSNQQWVVALRDTEQRRFAAILTTLSTPTPYDTNISQIEMKKKQRWSGKDKIVEHLLDGFFIMHHCAIEDPSNVVILNISGLDLHEVKEDDFLLFDNILQIDASENQLSFHGFKTFPQLIKLDLSFNQIKNIKFNFNDYEILEDLNLSYNNLTMHDVETLGVLSSLRILRVSGNDLVGLSRRLSKPSVHIDANGKEFVKERFPRLEELYLDHNKLAEDELFIHLSGLKNLKRLHLQHNQIRTIPFLKVLQGHQIVQEFSKAAMKRKNFHTSNQNLNYFQHGLNSTGDELIKSTIFEEDEEVTSNHQNQTNTSEDEDFSLPAFPELQYLDLSSNLIEEEDDVMAVASWPSLTEIILADNPLIQRHVGLPPLIESFLIDRLGMKIHRINPSLKPEKQFYAKPIKKNRKVTSRIAKVAKVPVDQIISGAVKQYIDYVKNETNSPSDDKLIPLLTSSSEQISLSDDEKFQTNQNLDENRFNNHSQTDDQSPNQQTENIFMTEFENDDVYQNVNPIERNASSTEEKIQIEQTLSPNSKFKGFELFLDIENEKEISVPNNVIHCVRDLKQLLRNPLIVRHDNIEVHRRQREFIPKKMERTLPPVKLPNRPKVEEINKILDIIRNRKTVIDQPLITILNNNKDKRNQKSAKKLVTEIQQHYEQVRNVSLRSVRTPGTILDTAIDRLQRLDTDISLKKQ